MQPTRRTLPDLPFSLLHFDRIDSTNLYLKELARTRPEHGLVVVADFQTAGQGRMGRRWEAAPGTGLCFSVLLAPVNPSEVGSVPLAAAVALYDTVSHHFPALRDSLDLKWPNDLLSRGRKLAGILTELDHSQSGEAFLVLGIGLNCSQTVFPPHLEDATSLQLEAGQAVDRWQILAAFLARWDRMGGFTGIDPRSSRRAWRPLPDPKVIQEWKDRSCFWKGRRLRWQSGSRMLTGTTCDLNASGALVVRMDGGGLQEITSGEVHEIRDADQ